MSIYVNKDHASSFIEIGLNSKLCAQHPLLGLINIYFVSTA